MNDSDLLIYQADDANKNGVVLIDASNLGAKVKDGTNKKTLLAEAEEDRIIEILDSVKVVRTIHEALKR